MFIGWEVKPQKAIGRFLQSEWMCYQGYQTGQEKRDCSIEPVQKASDWARDVCWGWTCGSMKAATPMSACTERAVFFCVGSQNMLIEPVLSGSFIKPAPPQYHHPHFEHGSVVNAPPSSLNGSARWMQPVELIAPSYWRSASLQSSHAVSPYGCPLGKGFD